MNIADRLLTSNLWKDAAAIARTAKTRYAAIAYVSTDTVKFKKGDVLITDASEATIASCGTVVSVLQAAYDRGAAIYSFPYLHAKVLLLDDWVIVGSANLSTTSAIDLEECAILTKDRKLVGQAKAFLQQLREQSQLLTKERLERLAKIPVVRRGGRGKRRHHKIPEQNHRCWIVGLTPIEDDRISEDDHKTRERAKRKALRKRPTHTQHLDWFRMRASSTLRKEAQAGDRVIMVSGSHGAATRLSVNPPVTILTREDGEDSTFFYFDRFDFGKRPELGKTNFFKLLKESGSNRVPSARMARELSENVVDLVDQHWPKR